MDVLNITHSLHNHTNLKQKKTDNFEQAHKASSILFGVQLPLKVIYFFSVTSIKLYFFQVYISRIVPRYSLIAFDERVTF